MDLIRNLKLLMIVLVVWVGASSAHAFMTSEDQQWEADIQQARARAQDFKRHLQRLEKQDQEREAEASRQVEGRAQFERVMDQARIAFIRVRESKPNPDEVEARLEKEWLKRAEADERERDLARQRYIAKRDAVKKVIAREAVIDEALEYGLKSRPGKKELSSTGNRN